MSWSQSTKVLYRPTDIGWILCLAYRQALKSPDIVGLFCPYSRSLLTLMSGLQLDSIPEKGVDYIRDFVPLVRSIQVCVLIKWVFICRK